MNNMFYVNLYAEGSSDGIYLVNGNDRRVMHITNLHFSHVSDTVTQKFTATIPKLAIRHNSVPVPSTSQSNIHPNALLHFLSQQLQWRLLGDYPTEILYVFSS